MNDRWPLQDFLELGALISAVPCARLHARQVLWEWGIGNLGDSADTASRISSTPRASRPDAAKPFRDRVADLDATIVLKLRAAGAVLLGKTTVGALA